MLRLILISLLVLTFQRSLHAAPKVVVSIVPLHSLVAKVMDGVGEPELLLKGINSEHQASYSPQQIASLAHADVVFIIGDNLEVKLGEMSGSDTVAGNSFTKMLNLAGLITHPIRVGGVWEQDADATGPVDPHIWLDPENALVMTAAIALELAKTDPENAKTYVANAEKAKRELAALEQELKVTLTPIQDKSFIVFHDAYQYFERRFQLNSAGSISDFSATPPSAKRLAEIRAKIASANATCVFREPQYSSAALNVVEEGSVAKSGELDAIGANLAPGKDAYNELLQALARNLVTCLR